MVGLIECGRLEFAWPQSVRKCARWICDLAYYGTPIVSAVPGGPIGFIKVSAPFQL